MASKPVSEVCPPPEVGTAAGPGPDVPDGASGGGAPGQGWLASRPQHHQQRAHLCSQPWSVVVLIMQSTKFMMIQKMFAWHQAFSEPNHTLAQSCQAQRQTLQTLKQCCQSGLISTHCLLKMLVGNVQKSLTFADDFTN